jgi:predicted ATPase
MLTRLEVDGFKSLRKFALDLEPFTVLVGPNGVGKSNVLEVIGLLARLGNLRPEDALKGGRGRASDQFSRYRSEGVQKMSIAVETLQPDHDRDESEQDIYFSTRWRYELGLSRVPGGAGVEHVELAKRARGILEEGDRWLDAHPEWMKQVVRDEREFEFLPSINLVGIDSGSEPREASDRIDHGELAPDASNLPSVLASLSEPELGEIRAEFVGLVPGVTGFEVVERDESYRIELHMRDGDVVPARLASGGTMRVLALLTAVCTGRRWTSVLCIEEPENGIYPGRLRRLIEILRDATDATGWVGEEAGSRPPLQVIVTSHSPVFLSALRGHPEHLRYLDTVLRDGVRATRARRVSAAASPRASRDEISVHEILAILEDAPRREDDR